MSQQKAKMTAEEKMKLNEETRKRAAIEEMNAAAVRHRQDQIVGLMASSRFLRVNMLLASFDGIVRDMTPEVRSIIRNDLLSMIDVIKEPEPVQ